MYRLIHFIEKFCNQSGGETCDLNKIKGVVNELPKNVDNIENDIADLMGQLNLGGGKKKKKMKGGTPEQLQQLLKLVHKGTILVQNSANQVIEGIDQTLVQIFTIANHVINDFSVFAAFDCVRLFMSTLIGEKLSKILESILIGAGAVGISMVSVSNAPKLVQYAPTILKYVATGGVVLTSSTVCFYIGDYVTNLSTLAVDKYNNLSVQGKTLINDLAEQVEKSQEGKVESATENIEKYNATVAELADKLKTLPPQDLIVLTTIENTDGDNANNSMTVTTTENGNEIDGDGDGDENTGNENEENNINVATTAAAANGKRKYDDITHVNTMQDNNAMEMEEQEEEEEAAVNDNKKKREGREEGGGKKKKKGRTTQKKKKGTKGKKKASKSKKSKTKKNRKTKKKSNKK